MKQIRIASHDVPVDILTRVCVCKRIAGAQMCAVAARILVKDQFGQASKATSHHLNDRCSTVGMLILCIDKNMSLMRYPNLMYC